MTQRIVLTEDAIEDFQSLNAHWRATVRDALATHLTHEPDKESKSRIKRLSGLNHPQYRLRVDHLRVYYDIAGTDVILLAVMPKERTLEWLAKHGKK